MAPGRLDSGINTPDNGQSLNVGSDLSIGIEPIAIVGMACRLPGDVNSASKFWEMLLESRSGQCNVPASRFNIDGFYHPDGASRPGSMNTKGGYFLSEDIRNFENSFFGINNLEATYMDPQQRKLLEVVYESFESAGMSLEMIAGANIGCYIGNFTMDFQVMQTRDAEYMHRYSATGMGTTILSNRISHVFDLRGPSLVLDTACSSSLYSLHQACIALQNRECDAAVVAGANLVQSPEQHLATMLAGVLSPSSTCHTFDSTADGYGRADGIGSLIVKRLSDAIRDGDPIRSVIRGTAVNSNGKTQGITLPSAAGQEAVIIKAYTVAGLEPCDTLYIECHGTGTRVGDPIEVEAVAKAFKRRNVEDGPILIGSVKTNVGHSEAASGITSIIKTVLALENATIPATIGIKTINPNIKTEEWNVKIVSQTTPWPASKIRRAGVNSFGYGGANAHVILESPQEFIPKSNGFDGYGFAEDMSTQNNCFILPFSATNEISLQSRVSTIQSESISLSDLAFTLGNRRSDLPVRGFSIAQKDSLKECLNIENLHTIESLPNCSPNVPIAFIFTGQGAAWCGMGKGLIDQFPYFRSRIMVMDSVLQSLSHPPAWTLLEAIRSMKTGENINDASQSQPACTALQIALVDLLSSWKIFPVSVIGHSSGEIAAAYTAGLLTVEEAIIIAYYRGYIIKKMATKGQMMAAALSPSDAQNVIDNCGLTSAIRVACINSPENVTLSGDYDAVDRLYESLKSKNIFVRKLATGDCAYHSHHMATVGGEYESLIKTAISSLKSCEVKNETKPEWISSVTLNSIRATPDPSYWRANLESPVMFSQAVSLLLKSHSFQIIEIGPHAALKLPIAQIGKSINLDRGGPSYLSTLSRGQDSAISVLKLVGNLYILGMNIGFQLVNFSNKAIKSFGNSAAKVLTDLPPYKWNYGQPLWSESRASVEFRNRKYLRHELLGSEIAGGNGIDLFWRNILKLKDVPWLEDHKLDQEIVFPAAAYLAMAVEAIFRGSGITPEPSLLVELKCVNIVAALVLSKETPVAGVEVFTSLRRQNLSAITMSKSWWQFQIASYKLGVSTIHATGSIRIITGQSSENRRISPSIDSMEPSAIRNWYSKLRAEGLNFGKEFQSMKELYIHRQKKISYIITTVNYLRQIPSPMKDNCQYVMHPITIDSMLQTSIIASTSGVIENLRGKIPVSIGSATFQVPNKSVEMTKCTVHAAAETTGFGSSMTTAEFQTQSKQTVAKMTDVRFAAHSVLVQTRSEERHPMLRVLWKPDILSLNLVPASYLLRYLDEFALGSSSLDVQLGIIPRLLGILDLLVHKLPNIRILEIGDGSCELTCRLLDLLRIDTAYRRCQSITTAKFMDSRLFSRKIVSTDSLKDESFREHNPSEIFDLIILSGTASVASYRIVKDILTPQGFLLTSCQQSSEHPFITDQEFRDIYCDFTDEQWRIILARRSSEAVTMIKESLDILLLERNRCSVVGNEIIKIFPELNIKRIELEQAPSQVIGLQTTVIATVELDEPLLSVMSAAQMADLKTITDRAGKIVWVTKGGILGGRSPEFGIVSGLARALMLEQPSLKFFTFTADDFPTPQLTAAYIAKLVAKRGDDVDTDFEYSQFNGITHVSRFVPDESLNNLFRQRQGHESVLKPAGCLDQFQLSIDTIGQIDTIHFKEVSVDSPLPSNYVEIVVKSFGLNAKDLYVLAGKVDTKYGTCGLEFSGVVRAIGSAVTTFTPGDRVVAMAPNHMTSIERVPVWACQKLREDEDYHVFATLNVVYATALYALHFRANIKYGESILIHSGAGGVGIASIQIAKLAGAEIFTTVSTQAKKDFLVATFDLDPDHIFNSRDSSFLENILKATNGRGVDIVLNSLTGDLLHDSWRACADFGRFVEIGKRDLTDSGLLDMRVFLRNATFTAFDMSELFYSSNPALQRIWSSLIENVMALYRKGDINAINPLTVFDLSNTVEAFRYFSLQSRMGKVAISITDPKSLIKIVPSKYSTVFSPEKSYLLIGCLGGLGRSISKWMLERGARKFIFLGRSGIDNKSAKLLVKDLEDAGAQISVIRGDVSIFSDVKTAVDSIKGLVGGVIQAAMGLSEALFTSMSHEQWHTGIKPKVIGTWNIHNALSDRESDLDFFLMLSSVSGSVGTATESNYCAANSFLDRFARYRLSLGLPAMSLGLGMISEVGYLHEHAEIEALLLRKGIQSINEEELLQIVDSALSNPNLPISYDKLALGHILTGLEPLGLKEIRKQGFEGNNPTFNDARASLLFHALESDSDSSVISVKSGAPDRFIFDKSNTQEIIAFIRQRFSNLILLQLDKVNNSKPLVAYGMDSMIAAEFRTWIYQTFNVDIPFFEFLAKEANLIGISKEVEKKLSS